MMIRIIFFLLSLSGFLYSVTQLSKYWEYEENDQNISTLMRDNVTNEQLSNTIITAINDDRLDDAGMYITIARRYHFPLDFSAFEKEIQLRNTLPHRVNTQVEHFAKGFLRGKGNDGASIAGSVTADFTVVGDVRDLKEQYDRQQAGKEVNKVITTLAGAGVGLTLLTIGTVGTAASVKGGVSLMKFAAKTNRLTKGFSKEIMQQTKHVFNWKRFSGSIKTSSKFSDLRHAAKTAFNPQAIKPLEATAKRLYKIRKASNISSTLHMMRYVDNTHDLQRLERFTLKHGTLAKGYLKLLGKGVLRSVKVLKKTSQFLLSIISSIVSGLLSLLFLFSYRSDR